MAFPEHWEMQYHYTFSTSRPAEAYRFGSVFCLSYPGHDGPEIRS